ncbi:MULTISPECIES: BCCT family transporter [Salegentibacter]|jgi:choline/glycine/proline betaine transport protein|uniref:Choline/glycine/proline betaine transport protein n=1 Tax=Salegentibacter agarivorans TaxID=345907 RepID=A0A1I2MU40_9FLAO|nr:MULTISPECIES: BCCT family transporter [Salegentibacter]MBO2545978.1 BCCT family transporter [Salegentibacter sp. BDJ18]SFF95002.1 choline/glycine/proline betaine transport protein [Salegentibacter agarivorans]|tara:strand:- start:2633 stop:4258 length:1626 start_codon:yes stop_codon:yes gene_type:complete
MAKKVTRSDEKKSIFGLEVNGPVFFISSFIIIVSIALTLIFEKQAETIFADIQTAVANNADWFFIMCVNIFLVFLVYLALGQFGNMRIGGQNAKPEFKTLSWFAMLFSAGMGIGLLFFSVGEPVMHFTAPPTGEPGTAAAAQEAMNFTFLHWGFHAWGVYALVGLALAYFTYTRGLPLTIRSIFYPFLGDKIYGKIGDAIDIFAVLATLFGLATSLGFGVQQIASGLDHVFNIPSGITTQVLLIAGITLIATISVVLGVDKGVKFLSEWNMRVALLLLGLALVLGPTVFIFRSFVENTGSYLFNFIEISTWSETFTNSSWQNDWTVFYWGWWIGWSPFVGMFIARISKGRTIREFVLGVLLVPSLVTFFWLSAFGSVSIQEALGGDMSIIDAVNDDIATALFVFFEDYPLSMVINVVAVILIAGFFITSSDSGSLVIDSLTSGGKIDAPKGQRIFWAVTEGTVAAVLLIGGGLQALQTATIVTGLPFAVILLIMCYSLYKGLKEDLVEMQDKKEQKEMENYEDIVNDIVKKRNLGKNNNQN